jgi:hypothetical protein
MKYDWQTEKETILETGFYERLANAPRPKLPIEKW